MASKAFEGLFKGKQDKLEEKIDIETSLLLAKLEAFEVITKQQRTAIEVTVVTVLS